MHAGLVRHQCYRKFTSLPFVLYSDTRISIIPNFKRSFQVGCDSVISNRAFCGMANSNFMRPQTISFLKLPYSCQISHSAIMGAPEIQPGQSVGTIDYNQLLEAQKGGSGILIVDVREPEEINKTGKLPGSINIPMNDVRHVLRYLSDDDFKDKYCTNKPTKDTKIILSCRSGKRSDLACMLLQEIGYTKVYNYTGGWLEWESKQKALTGQK